MVSEVVTNALVHAGTDIDLAVRADHSGVRVEVGDGSPHLPTARRYTAMAGTGRGMMLLTQMVDDWGAEPVDGGKMVWFYLSHGSPEPSHREPPVRAVEARSAQTARIRLLNVPVLLHEAWHQHIEALLREYLLVSLEDRPEPEAIQMHAEASDALSLLAEHIPRPAMDKAPEQAMSDAEEPNASSPAVEVFVPEESLGHFETLSRAIDEALSMADRGQLLTPPTQPELRLFRRWVCTEVKGQSEGAEPVPWALPAPPPVPWDTVDWDTGDVATDLEAAIAVDDTNQIIAVSATALELLGYDDDEELLGQRIVTIIPPRFRQAHVAGFTLHLLTGRGPLIGHTVVVPAIRRDGTETLIELSLTAHRAAHGRTVYVAELREPSS